MREKERVRVPCEPFVQKKDDTTVGFGTNHSSGGLQDAVHARKGVGEIEARMITCLPVFANEIAFEAELWEANADDGDTDEPFADEVDAFTEDTTQDSKRNKGEV